MRRNNNSRTFDGTHTLERWPEDGHGKPIIGDNPQGVETKWWVFAGRAPLGDTPIAGPFDTCPKAKGFVRYLKWRC